MDNLKLFDAERKFMDLIWEHEPVNSTELVQVCRERLGWKKSTTYTVLRKLRGRNIVKNEEAVVTSLVSRAEIQKYEGENLLNKAFEGSLPKFLTAFLEDRTITTREAEELKKIIDKSREET
jgi:BlaI family transcriptional regulator, penicillinase repressor